MVGIICSNPCSDRDRFQASSAYSLHSVRCAYFSAVFGPTLSGCSSRWKSIAVRWRRVSSQKRHSKAKGIDGNLGVIPAPYWTLSKTYRFSPKALNPMWDWWIIAIMCGSTLPVVPLVSCTASQPSVYPWCVPSLQFPSCTYHWLLLELCKPYDHSCVFEYSLLTLTCLSRWSQSRPPASPSSLCWAQPRSRHIHSNHARTTYIPVAGRFSILWPGRRKSTLIVMDSVAARYTSTHDLKYAKKWLRL